MLIFNQSSENTTKIIRVSEALRNNTRNAATAVGYWKIRDMCCTGCIKWVGGELCSAGLNDRCLRRTAGSAYILQLHEAKTE